MKYVTVGFLVLVITSWLSFFIVLAGEPGVGTQRPQRISIICPGTGDPAEDVQWPDGKKTRNKIHWRDVNDGDIDGDGKQDLQGTPQTDEEGNSIECWCLQASEKHAQRIYCLEISKTGVKKFFGGCYFTNGYNGVQFPGAEPSKKKGATYKKIGPVEQENISQWPPKTSGKDSDPPGPELDDYHFEKNGDACASYATKGHYKWVSAKGGWTYESKTVPGSEKHYPCPEGPGGLQLPTAVAEGEGNYQGNMVNLFHDPSALPLWRYRLEKDTGNAQTLPAGSRIWIAASGIVDANVAEPASLPAYGAWQLEDVDAEGITFISSVETALVGVTSGFEFTSPDAMGEGKWYLDGGMVTGGGLSFGPVHEVDLIRRWDVDLSGRIDITDPILIIGHLFTGGPALTCPRAADANGDGGLDISDAVMVLMWMFQGTEGPSPQFTDGCY